MLAFRRDFGRPNPVLVELFDVLRGRGFRVEIGVAEELVVRPETLGVKHDLYILKSHTSLWLSLAGVLHLQGARLLNPYLPCIATRNKIMAARWLCAAGIPIPRSWVTGDLQRLHPVADEKPLIIKPFDGRRGDGIHIVRGPGELAAVPPPEQPVLVQEYIPSNGEDLKVYVIGDEVFGVRQPSPTKGSTSPRRPCSVSAAVHKNALRCGQVFGLGLYGLDIVEGPAGPLVVDLNYFPSYRDVPGAAGLLADYIADYAYADCPRLALDETGATASA